VNRRHFLAASALPLVSIAAPGLLTFARAQPVPFDRSVARQMARDLAGKSFKAPDNKLPDNLKDLDYDRYRAIRVLPERALWRGEQQPFEAQFFHRGFFYANRVDIYEVKNGQAAKIAYQPDLFSFGDLAPPGAGVDLGFAGFRLHAPVNKPDYYDEVCVFSRRELLAGRR
jgi:glucans biosynthesis protein